MAGKSDYASYSSFFSSRAQSYLVRPPDRHYPAEKYAKRPRCYICANEFTADRVHYEYAANAQWVKDYSGFCPDVDMERMKYWKKPSWAIFYRMILYDPKDRMYHVSGAAQYPLDGPVRCVVPWDKKKGVIGSPDEVEQLAAPKLAEWADDLEKAKSLTGYMVHQLCWKRLVLLTGRDAEAQLRMLSHILRSRPGLDPVWQIRLPPGLKFERAKETSKEELSRYNYTKPSTKNDDDSGHNTTIQSLITKSRKRVEHNTPISLSPLAVESRITRLSLELQYLIMDELDDRRDVRRAKQQLRWFLPDEYWRKRIDVVRYYEVEYLAGLRLPRDWEYLCLGLEALTKKDEPRKVFLKTVYAIKLVFCCCLGEGASGAGDRRDGGGFRGGMVQRCIDYLLSSCDAIVRCFFVLFGWA